MKKIIIVDVFDVALKSLVLEYRDLFEFLNVDFRKLFPDRQIIEFSNLRYDTEHNKKLKSTDDIYTYISNKYDLDSKKIEKIMQKEIQLVFNLYIKRESLYNYVKNKEVIFINNKKYKTSIIKELLNKYGYNTDNIVTIIDELELYNYLNNMNSKYKITYISADYNHIDYCNHNDIDSVFYPKTTDIFMDYINECKVNKIGLINKKIFSKMVNLSKYTEITGVRLSIALVASKLCDDINFNIKYDFNSDKKIIGYYCLGMHLLAICSWLYNESNGKLIVFMGRDGYLPKKAIQIYNKDIKTDYLEISRKSYIPVLIKQKEDLFFLKDYINVKNCTCKDIFELIEVIISMPIKEQKRIDKKEKLNIESFTNFINDIKKYFDAEKQKEYTNTFRLYIKRIIKRDSVIFDIGYSGFPEYLIEEFIPYKLKTCFIHTRNSKAYQNSYYNRGYELSTFYKGHPKYYGTLREILISDTKPSCIGYTSNNDDEVTINYDKIGLGKKETTIIKQIQEEALNFIHDFTNIHRDYIDFIDLNSMYMSLPMEYFMQYTKHEEKEEIFGKKFKFEINHKESINLIDNWEEQLKE